MPRSPKLNWEPSRSKWKAVYRGKKYRFDGGTGKSDREAKKVAEAEFRKICGQVDAEVGQEKPHRQEYERALEEWKSVLRWSIEHEDESNREIAERSITRLEGQLARKSPPPLNFYRDFVFDPTADLLGRAVPTSADLIDPFNGLSPGGQNSTDDTSDLWCDRLDSLAQRSRTTDVDDSLEANILKFLEGKRAEVDAGDVSAGRVNFLRGYLDVAQDFIGPKSSVRTINGTMLYEFRQLLLQRKADGTYSASYARDVLAAFKQFVRWLARSTDKLESLPKNIDDKSLSIAVPGQKVKTLELRKVPSIVNAATDRTRLYLLLGLNCAMTQKDMADLRTEEVDWLNGTITRKRSKTRHVDGVPEVSYQLWPSTLDLLTQEKSSDSDLVLLTRDGRPLRTDTLDKSGNYCKTDAVRLAIRHLSKKTGVSFSMTHFKKTAASLLRNSSEYKGIESLFLDHAPKSVSDKHYAAIPQELLDAAIKWLGEQLGVDSITEER